MPNHICENEFVSKPVLFSSTALIKCICTTPKICTHFLQNPVDTGLIMEYSGDKEFREAPN